MGNQASSELEQTCRRLEDLKNKPDLLKTELRKFVVQLPLEHSVDVRVDKKLFDILMNLLLLELRKEGSPDLHVISQAFQRLLRIRGFYSAVPRCTVVPLIQSLQMRDPKNVETTLHAVAALLDCRCQPDKKFDKNVAELQAKQAFFESQGYDVLVKRVLVPYGRSSHSGVVAKVLDILALDLVDHCVTTRFVGIQKLLALLSPHVDLLLELTTSNDLNTRCYASILLQGYLLHSSLQTTQNLQSKVLEEGHLLHYILFAIDGANLPSGHPYVKYLYDKNLTELSRNLLGLLCAGNPQIVEICVQKTIPKPLQLSLQSMGADSASNSSFGGRSKQDKEQIKNTLWNNFQSGRMKRVNIHPQFIALDNEVREPHVLWTLSTKAELCMGLLKEIEDLQRQREVARNVRWDYDGWEISYKSLDRYLRVGGFYISLLLPVLADKQSSYVIELERIHMLLAALFQRSVIEDDPGWKLACLRTMSALYTKYGEQLTRDLEIIPYFAWLIDPRHTLPIYRDHILTMMQTLLKDAGNVRRFVKAGGVAHLLYYISRVLCVPEPKEVAAAGSGGKAAKAKKGSIIKKKQLVESSDDEDEEAEEKKEGEEGEGAENGQLSPSAGGVVSGSADEDQDRNGKQNLLGGLPLPLGVPETASLCLSLLKQIQSAGPKMKRVMSERDVVATLVRLLMCPVPAVKEEGIKLLLEVLEHSTHLVPRLITTGMFSFLVYGLRFGTSPAVLELLGKYHLKQDRTIVPASESALAPYFPRALVDVLKSQGAEAFGQVFESRDASGSNAAAAGTEFLWNAALKKHLMDVMSRRLGSFRALLDKDPLVEYKFSGPPEPIRYPSLESDLEMAGVSLRALNETGGQAEAMSQLNLPDPDELMGELVHSLNARRYAGIDLLTILTAQVVLIKCFPTLPDVSSYSGWEALFEIMASRAESDFPMIEKSAEIIHVLLALKHGKQAQHHEDDDEEHSNLAAFLDAKGLQLLVKTLEYFSSLRVNNILIQRILIDLLNCVYDVGVQAPDALAKELGTQRKLVRKLVLDFLGNRTTQSHPMLSVVACKAIMALSLADKFQMILLDTGALLHLIDMAVFYRSTASEEAAAAGTTAQKGLDEERRVRLAASSVLSLLAGFNTPLLRPEANAQVQRVLGALLTPDLVQTLASPSAFVTRVSAHRAQLQPLYKYVEGELIGINKFAEWPQRNWLAVPQLKMTFKPAAGQPQQQQRAQRQPQYADEQDGEDAQQDEQPAEYDEHDQNGAAEPADDLPDAYAASAPQARVLSPGEKMQDSLSNFGNSVEGAFASFRSKAANALTPVRASLASKAQAAKASVKGATQSGKVQRAGAQVQAGANKAAAAAAPQIQAAKQAAAPAAVAVQNAASKTGAQVQKAAAAAAPKVEQAKQVVAPKLAAAGAAVGSAASSVVSSAKAAAANLAAAAPVATRDAEDDEEVEEVHSSKEFYANARGDLLSPGGVKSPSTQHTPYSPDAASPDLQTYDDGAAEEEQQQQEAEYPDEPDEPAEPEEQYADDDAAAAADPHGFDGGNEDYSAGADEPAGSAEEEYADADAADYDEQGADADYPAADGEQYQQQDQEEYEEQHYDANGQGAAQADEEDVQEPQPVVSNEQRLPISPSGRVILSSR